MEINNLIIKSEKRLDLSQIFYHRLLRNVYKYICNI